MKSIKTKRPRNAGAESVDITATSFLTRLVLAATVALSICTISAGQIDSSPNDEAIAEFKACYGSDWTYQVSPETGLVSLMMGGRIELPGALEDPVATARRFLETNQALLGFARPEDTLAYDRTTGLSSGGRVVSFNQLYKNIPVWQHRALVCFTEEGVLNYMSSGIWPIADIDVKPRITAKQAERIIARSEGDEDVTAKRPAELVLLARGEGVLAWYSIFDVGSPQLPIRYFVDAKSGAIIERTELAHYRQEPPRRRSPVDPETVPPPLLLRIILVCITLHKILTALLTSV